VALRIQDDIETFLKLYEGGLSVLQIKEKTRVGKDTVYRHLKAQGVVFSPKKGGRKKKQEIDGAIAS
jgi:transposase